MTRKRAALIGAVCALAGSAATAGAQTTDILGHGGVTYVFDAQCHRVTFVPPGISTKEGLNVTAQQVTCLVRRPDPFARCVKRLGAAPSVVGRFDHGPGKPGDWTNVDQLQAYVSAVAACSKARY